MARWAAVAVVAGLVASGCGGGEPATNPVTRTAAPVEAPSTTPPAASAEPTPEPTGPPVTVPGVDPEGARQAAVEFMEAVGRAWQSGDTTEIRARSEEMCAYCIGQAGDIEKMVDAGEHVTEESELSVLSSEGFVPQPNNEFHSALVEVNESAAEFLDSDGEVVATSPELRFLMLIALRKTADGWSVVDGVEVSPQEAAMLRDERSTP